MDELTNRALIVEHNLADAHRYIITCSELKEVLNRYSASHNEFAQYIGVSRSTVTRWINGSVSKIGIKYSQLLEKFVGEDTYLMIIAEYREKRKKIFQTY